MELINIDKGLFCYLLGSFIVEEKRKEGLVPSPASGEMIFKTFVGFYCHEFLTQNTNLISQKSYLERCNQLDVD